MFGPSEEEVKERMAMKARNAELLQMMFSEGEARQAYLSAIDSTFGHVFDYIYLMTEDGDPAQEAAVRALAEACKQTKLAFRTNLDNGKFPAPEAYRTLVGLKFADRD